MEKTLFETLLNCVGTNIVNFLNDSNKDYVRKVLLNAYNTYQEDERFGVDYIFHIENVDDVKCCIEGGMQINEVSHLWVEFMKGTHSGYFFFGENYPIAKPLSQLELHTQLVEYIEEILPYVMTYPQRGGYKEFYNCFVAPIWA
jgi:hypothetical protein